MAIEEEAILTTLMGLRKVHLSGFHWPLQDRFSRIHPCTKYCTVASGSFSTFYICVKHSITGSSITGKIGSHKRRVLRTVGRFSKGTKKKRKETDKKRMSHPTIAHQLPSYQDTIGMFFCSYILIASLVITMSKANYQPPSLTGKPTKALVPPGQCQFTDELKSVPLMERIPVSSTSSVLRFGLPDTSAPLNLSTCACILARAEIGGEEVIRPYTPISTNELKGCFDLLIKDYGSGAKMSKHLCEDLKVGETVDFKHIKFNVKIQAPFKQKKICMLVGGTGITPMIQALHAILGDTDSDTEVVMLYGSKVSTDILGQELLDNWAKDHKDRFKVVHVLSEEPADSDWTGTRGFIDKELIKSNFPDPSAGDDLMIFVCGPPPLYNALCGPRDEKELTGALGDMGYKAEQVFKF
eukprot:scaffold517_cov119-Cylindrotheca_fusiformis.AAC.28